jgi:hypothetical protein
MRGQIASLLALLGLASPASCDAAHIQAVGSPGGAFRSGAGCSPDDLQAAGPVACMFPAQLGFEQLADDALLEVTTGNLKGKQVSCRRSYCGAGALVLHADYRWRVGVPPVSNEKLGELRHRLATPTDVYGKTMTCALYVDGPDTPVNAYIAVIDTTGRFHMVHDEPVLIFRRWTQRGAAVLASNLELNLPPGATSLVVKEILIAVYLATDVRTGDNDHWSADFYLDQIAWN